MSKIIFTLLVSNLCFTTLQSAEHREAKELFIDAKCMSCHNDRDFTPKEKMQDYKTLHKAVNACRYANNIEWFDDESVQVTKYLNHKYYKFEVKD